MKLNNGPGKTSPAQPPKVEAGDEPTTITLPNGRTVPVPKGMIALSCRRGSKVIFGGELEIGQEPVIIDAGAFSAEKWHDVLSDPMVKAMQVS